MEEIFDAFVKFSVNLHAKDEFNKEFLKAWNWDKERCGECQYWMTRGCPSEKNVNGRNRGPSMNGCACFKYEVKVLTIREKIKRLKELKNNKCYRFLPLLIKLLVSKYIMDNEKYLKSADVCT